MLDLNKNNKLGNTSLKKNKLGGSNTKEKLICVNNFDKTEEYSIKVNVEDKKGIMKLTNNESQCDYSLAIDSSDEIFLKFLENNDFFDEGDYSKLNDLENEIKDLLDEEEFEEIEKKLEEYKKLINKMEDGINNYKKFTDKINIKYNEKNYEINYKKYPDELEIKEKESESGNTTEISEPKFYLTSKINKAIKGGYKTRRNIHSRTKRKKNSPISLKYTKKIGNNKISKTLKRMKNL